MKTLSAPTPRRRAAALPKLSRAGMLQMAMNAIALDTPDDPGVGRLAPDVICAANESRYIQAYFSEPLTTYAVGWKDPNDIEATLNFFAPTVLVGRRFEYAVANNLEEFLSDVDDIRAVGGDFKRVEYVATKTLGKTLNKGLTIRVDLDEVGDDLTNWREMTVAKLKRRCLRNELRRVIAALSAAATNVAKTWNTSAGVDPDGDVATEMVNIATASGIAPNRIGYGDTAWLKRFLAYRAQNNAGGYASAGLTAEQVASGLGLGRGYVSKERFQNTGATKAEIVSNLVFLFYAMDGADTEDPSNIKRFVSNTITGGTWRVFEQQIGPKLYEITIEYYSDIQITSPLGLEKITVS